MSTTTTVPAVSKMTELKQFFEKDSVKNKFADLVGKKSNLFIASVMQLVGSNTYLANASVDSIYQAAYLAAVVGLPINNNLGKAYIVPYGGQAQMQIGWKGFVELAIRSGFYKKIKPTIIYENMFISWDEVDEDLVYDKNVRGTGKIIGYYAKFELLNGYQKADFWYYDEVEAHGKKYSKTYNNGPWKTEFDDMALKTVLKAILKYGPMSIEMQQAYEADQSVVVDAEKGEYSYEDNPDSEKSDAAKPDSITHPDSERAIKFLENAKHDNDIKEVKEQAKPHTWPKDAQEKYFKALSAAEKRIEDAYNGRP